MISSIALILTVKRSPMTKKTEVYFAQALDNISADHIQLNEEILETAQKDKRASAIAFISKISGHEQLRALSGAVKMIASPYGYLIELPSVEFDQSGRIAPILYASAYDANQEIKDRDGDVILEGLKAFANKIGRTLDNRHGKDINACLRELSKKKTAMIPRALPRILILAIIILALFLLKKFAKL